MAIKLIDVKADGTEQYIADTDADVSSLPTDVSVGSTCVVIGTGGGGKVLMLNTVGSWVEI